MMAGTIPASDRAGPNAAANGITTAATVTAIRSRSSLGGSRLDTAKGLVRATGRIPPRPRRSVVHHICTTGVGEQSRQAVGYGLLDLWQDAAIDIEGRDQEADRGVTKVVEVSP
jgi:hypothetical protein